MVAPMFFRLFVEAMLNKYIGRHLLPVMMRDDESDLDRYRRQILIPSIGEEGQRRLASSTVGVLGQGGLGSPCTMYLAAAGIGKLILVDQKPPRISNLNRQVIHGERAVDQEVPKAVSAMGWIKGLNSEIDVEAHNLVIDEDNIDGVFSEAEIIVDCLDDFAPRYILNDYCVSRGKPFVHCGIESFNGQMTTIVPGETPCLRCIFPDVPSTKDEIPIIGVTAGVFGTMEAAEVIKLILDIGSPLKNRLLFGDLMYQTWEDIEVYRSEKCPVCSNLPR
jgi:molybdopterin/thiamine biosynthesis adenylyltransferase